MIGPRRLDGRCAVTAGQAVDWSEVEPVLPDYAGACLSNVVPALLDPPPEQSM